MLCARAVQGLSAIVRLAMQLCCQGGVQHPAMHLILSIMVPALCPCPQDMREAGRRFGSSSVQLQLVGGGVAALAGMPGCCRCTHCFWEG